MKLEFKLGKLEIEEIGVVVEDIQVSQEYSIEEIKESYGLAKAMLTEMPKIINGMKTLFVEMMQAEYEMTKAANERVLRNEEKKDAQQNTSTMNLLKK